jgi:hypothetical protein
MAYRFLLEVPAKLSADANVAVSTAGDAQVLVERPAHGRGFDDPYADLTVAAHSLQVVNNLYRWADEIGATRTDSRLLVGVVLHSGQRIGLHEIDGPGLVAAIRRDQPWVERSVPKIGEHERDTGSPALAKSATKSFAVASRASARPATVTAVNLIDAEEELTMGGRNYAVIQVLELPNAEHIYSDVMQLELDQRMRQDADGEWQSLGSDYDHDIAAQENTEADIAFMHNGPLSVALVRAGRAARLDYSTVQNQLTVTMEPEAAARVKALALMRGYTMLTSAGPSYSFRDPFGVVWGIHPHEG